MTILEIDAGDLRVDSVRVSESELIVTLGDGRVLATPLSWYPKLQAATPEQRANFEIMPMGLHWPDLDEDLSVAGMLAGRKASGAD